MAKKTVAVKKTAAKKPADPKARAVSIDYPKPGEIVRPGHYSVRVSAPAAQAQVRFDQGAWQDCRESIGHFWYDWAPQAGRVCLQARARTETGRWSAVAEREVVVVLEGPERDGAVFA